MEWPIIYFLHFFFTTGYRAHPTKYCMLLFNVFRSQFLNFILYIIRYVLLNYEYYTVALHPASCMFRLCRTRARCLAHSQVCRRPSTTSSSAAPHNWPPCAERTPQTDCCSSWKDEDFATQTTLQGWLPRSKGNTR